FILCSSILLLYVFFFQAEDGIRDFHVTGVQTCALPIYMRFLIRRRDRPLDGGRMVRLSVSSEDRLLAVLRRWKKEVYHVMEVFDRKGRRLGCIPEEAVLKRFFEGGNPRARIGELLR